MECGEIIWVSSTNVVSWQWISLRRMTRFVEFVLDEAEFVREIANRIAWLDGD